MFWKLSVQLKKKIEYKNDGVIFLKLIIGNSFKYNLLLQKQQKK